MKSTYKEETRRRRRVRLRLSDQRNNRLITKKGTKIIKYKEDAALDTALTVLNEARNKTPKEMDEDDTFAKNVAFSLRKVADQISKVYAKVKIQEILYKAQFGVLLQPSVNYNYQATTTTTPPIHFQHQAHPYRNNITIRPPYHLNRLIFGIALYIIILLSISYCIL